MTQPSAPGEQSAPRPTAHPTAPMLTVVIPAYNEEATIGRALDALVAQADQIDEIIVVDNNCTDDTVAVAQAHEAAGKIRIITEELPGLIPARNAGIAAAKTPIVARIDADTIVQPGWAQAIREFFATADAGFGAALGPFEQYDMPLQGVQRFMVRVASDTKKDAGIQEARGVYGANMAVRKTAWETILPALHEGRGIWEDSDISLSLHGAGIKIAMLPGMKVQVSGRRMLSSRKSYFEYTASLPRTLRAHGLTKQARVSWIGVWLVRTMYFIFWIPTRSFDPVTRKYSVRRIFSDHEDRIIP
ncbi:MULTISPECIES: glycosyltransferase family 2 protein [unclassified Rhodococcus (in: high G+C Gram-positive bacteria)]|uniref:glycosyltransferase n=1 Tax=unclassified Rhodococcus (in: high G+C Gram-positive bacteria) TaxID=192944 RepID=UPI00163B0CDC|nr:MULTISPECIES: glycosyltransferase family 2 protein [unclassified Rhodococcus (in: high G+C Gram-positive bacteria)]MBC2641549.1 glycosyltransferase family 2 protein [Rhodococcus sp. 3A]MBC2893706.1 glycosyltransferase family 2 protein [Rhodococcus sp. 4CII]